MSMEANASETTPLVVEKRRDPLRATLLSAKISAWLSRRLEGYGKYASLQESWTYFEYFILPRRTKNADGSYSKAPAGDETSTLYPAWTTPQHQLKDFGTGIAVYFETLLALMFICLIAGLLYLPSIWYFDSDGYTSTQIQTLAGPLRGSLLCPEPKWVPCPDCDLADWTDSLSRVGENAHGLVFAKKNTCAPLMWGLGINHLVVMTFITIAIFFLGRYQRKLELRYDESVLTASDFSIQVDNPPADAVDPDEWKQFFSQFGDVAYVTVALNNHDFIQPLVRRRVLLQKAFFHMQSVGTAPLQTIPACLEITKPKLYEILVAVEAKCRTLARKSFPTSAVFVTFEKERAQRLALQKLQVGRLNIDNNRTEVLAPDHRFRDSLVLDIFEAPEPSAIRWQDLDETLARKILERIVTVVLSFGVIIFGFLLVASAYKTNLGLAATEITLLNILMPFVFKLINSLESHQSESTYQASLYWKIGLFRFINTGVVTILIKPATSTLSDSPDGLIRAVHAVLKAEIIIAPIIKMADMAGHLKRQILAPRALNQSAMNSYFRGGKQFLGEKYTNVTKTIFLVFFYSAIFPSGFFYGAIALFLTYVTEKFLLLRSWAPVPKLGDDVARLSRKVLFPLTAVILAVMSEFFYSAYPCDNLCDTDTVAETGNKYLGSHIVTAAAAAANEAQYGNIVKVQAGDTLYRYCDQDFLERLNNLVNFFFEEKDDWMKGDQKNIVYVFGVFAVAVISLFVFVYLSDGYKKVEKIMLGGFVRTTRLLHTSADKTFQSTTERDSGESYSDQETIIAYIPQVPNDNFNFPLIAADATQFKVGQYVGWRDPTVDHDFYNLQNDVDALFRHSSGDRPSALLSRVKQYC